MLISTARCAVSVRVFFLTVAAAAAVCISEGLAEERFYTDVEAGMGREYGV